MDGRDRRELIGFGALALALAAPFWWVGRSGGRLPIPFEALPVTALGFVVPGVAALAAAGASGKLGDLARQARPRGGAGWWLAAVAAFSGPTLFDAVLRSGAWRSGGVPLLMGSALAYGVAAVGEELGWTAFALPRLLRVTDSVAASAFISSAYWVAWHAIPFAQTGNDAVWVAGQCVQAALMRTTIVGLSAGSGDRLWLAVLLHAATNVAWSVAPPGYRPWCVDAQALPIAGLALVVGARHRTRNNGSGASRD